MGMICFGLSEGFAVTPKPSSEIYEQCKADGLKCRLRIPPGAATRFDVSSASLEDRGVIQFFPQSLKIRGRLPSVEQNAYVHGNGCAFLGSYWYYCSPPDGRIVDPDRPWIEGLWRFFCELRPASAERIISDLAPAFPKASHGAEAARIISGLIPAFPKASHAAEAAQRLASKMDIGGAIMQMESTAKPGAEKRISVIPAHRNSDLPVEASWLREAFPEIHPIDAAYGSSGPVRLADFKRALKKNPLDISEADRKFFVTPRWLHINFPGRFF